MLPSKRGIGLLMAALNGVNVLGFILIMVLQATGNVTWGGLYAFVIVIGFASVLPVSLPFQV
eukprot:4842441-Prymnesium_polylepis.1